jgi:N-acyl-D-aspartate/D-glutamate deacylase
MFDLVVRGGLVVDGTGMPAFRADVGVRDGRVVHIGRVDPAGAIRTVDATDRVVAPGFIDIHTHFDAQLSWDPLATPVLEHGVTTVVTGNCSLSLAPLRAEQRGRLSRMFGQIEQLPEAVFAEGVDWSWESFAGWLDARAGRLGPNVAPLVGHSALRMFVMGDDAHERAATDAETGRMQDELRAALAAGAAGLSVSCVDVDERGRPVPSRLAEAAEIDRLAACLGDAGAVLQIVPEYWDSALVRQRVDELAALSLRHGIATTFAPLIDQTPGLVDEVLAHLDGVRATGARVHAQVQPRGIDVNFRLCEWNFALYRCSGWSRILRLTDRDAQLAAYTDRETRRQLTATAYPDDDPAKRALLETAYVSHVEDPDLGSLVGRTLADLAAERGVDPAEAMIEIAVRDGLETRFTRPPSSNVDPDTMVRMLRHPDVLVGASDAGAHVRGFSTYGDTSHVLAELVRRRHVFGLEEAVQRLTSDLARSWNLPGRGRVAVGAAADLVVFDPATVDRGPELDRADLPSGGRRYLRGSVGVDATIVNGEPVWTRADGYTGALPGALASRRSG